SPIWVQNVLCSVEGWRIQRLRYGNGFDDLLRQAEERSRWSQARMIEYRNRRLNEFVRFAYNASPFYRELFDEHRIDPCSVKNLEALAAIPILDKPTVQEHLEKIAIGPPD